MPYQVFGGIVILLICLLTLVCGGSKMPDQRERVSKYSSLPIAAAPSLDEPIATPLNPELPAAEKFAAAVKLLLREGKSAADQSAAFAAARQTVKQYLAVKEIKNARAQRNDPQLLQDRYPKTGEIRVNGQSIYWTGYDRLHFAARHLVDYCDLSDIKEKNSWWPAGTTREEVDEYLKQVLLTYRGEIRLPAAGKTAPGFKYFNWRLPGTELQLDVGITSEGRVTSFFPRQGRNVVSLSSEQVRQLTAIVSAP
jgi:hypothetical protein